MNKNIFSEKGEINTKLKDKYWLLKKNKLVWIVKLSDKNLIIDLRDALVNLPVWFILEIDWAKSDEKIGKNIVATSKVEDTDLSWFDFIICDSKTEYLKKYLDLGIVPIISKNNQLWNILTEYNPAKNEWNSYIYDKENKWDIFYALVRYMENAKFPADNKFLVKNILEM